MSKPKQACKHCGLPVGTPFFTLKTKDGELVFCCEGCKRVYQLLLDKQASPKPK
jgi:hypothetical protein